MNQQPISLIIVVHQEADIIEPVIKEFYEKVTSKISGSEFIVCEDGSTDGTKEILRRIKDRYHLTLDMVDGKRGYINAMRDGYRQAKNPVILFSDSDGQHDPDDFWKMSPLLEKLDMIVGWKKTRLDPWYRLFLAFVFNKLIGLYFGFGLHDIDCGFRLIKRPVRDFLLTQEWRLKHCTNGELAVKAHFAGFKVSEIPVSHFSRKFGASVGLPFAKLPKIIWNILKAFPKIKQDIRAIKANVSN